MPGIPNDLVRRLFEQARAARWNVPLEAFAEALGRSAARCGAGGPAALDAGLSALHLEDLALACACERGSEDAWDHFVREYRPALYRAGLAIDSSGGGRELADSLYAELFGLTERDGQRLSLFRYFHGRSSLGTWLRAVLAQRYVDRVRTSRRFEPLADEDTPETLAAAMPAGDAESQGAVEVIRRALGEAVARLAPKDRLRLGWYYAQEMTLAQIGRVMKEHEATVSRNLNRTRKALKADIEAQLQASGMGAAEMGECFAAAMDDPGAVDLGDMLEVADPRKKARLDRSQNEGMP
jgi:RNA polymerase sigma-70 factor (ECF subfamily)